MFTKVVKAADHDAEVAELTAKLAELEETIKSYEKDYDERYRR